MPAPLEKAQIVSFHCVLKNQLGQLISSTFNQGVLTAAPESGAMLKGLARGLQNLTKGERRRIYVSAADAYGFYDPGQVIIRAVEQVTSIKPLSPGDELFLSQGGLKKCYRVLEVSLGQVTLDGNHPLAGQDLVFEIEALDARDATPQEVIEACELVVPEVVLH